MRFVKEYWHWYGGRKYNRYYIVIRGKWIRVPWLPMNFLYYIGKFIAILKALPKGIKEIEDYWEEHSVITKDGECITYFGFYSNRINWYDELLGYEDTEIVYM